MCKYSCYLANLFITGVKKEKRHNRIKFYLVLLLYENDNNHA